MKCGRARSLMGAYLYGDLEPAEMLEIRLHARQCEKCSHDLEQRSRALSMLGGAAPLLTDEEKEQMTWSVKGAVRADRARTRRGAAWAPALAVTVALLAGLGIGALIGLHTGNSHRNAQPNATMPRVVITEDHGTPPQMRDRQDGKTAMEAADKQQAPGRMDNNDGPPRQNHPRLRMDPGSLLPTAVTNTTPTTRSRSDSNRLLPPPEDQAPEVDTQSASENADQPEPEPVDTAQEAPDQTEPVEAE